VVQAALVTLVAIPFGFQLYPVHVLAGLLLLCYFSHPMSTLLALRSLAILWLATLPGRSFAVHVRRLLPSLVEEFADRHSAVEIRGCADAILARYNDAPVRSYTTILATRQARDCLREDTCASLSTT
jgi:hypothetical protein